MPRKGYTGVTIKREIYDRLKKYYDLHKDELAKKGINSFTAFIQMTAFHYIDEAEASLKKTSRETTG